jgi:PPOX class probable F420-dependent enzyme
MIAAIPDTHKDLLEKPVVVALATIMPDGQPQVNCVWCLFDGVDLWFFTLSGFQKERNLRRRPQATVLAIDPQNPYRYLEVRGTVEALTAEGAEELADRLTQKYVGKPTYFGNVAPLEQKGRIELIACQLRPQRVVAYG